MFRDDPLSGLLLASGYQPLPGKEWRVPLEVDLDGERLVWSEKVGRVVRPEKEALQELLEGFVGLSRAPAKKILTYARRWGVLKLCIHDFPFNHPPDYWPSRPIEAHACPYVILDNHDPNVPIGQADVHRCLPRGLIDGQPWEPVEAWRYWALRARATITIAAALHQGRIGAEQDWRVICGTEGMPTGRGYWSPPLSVNDGKLRLIEMVNRWLALGVRPWLEWREKFPRWTVGGGGLFGALALQLALHTSRAKGLAICDGCGVGYPPKRWPRAGERRYCPDCQKGKLPMRDASQDYRDRRAKARSLADQGLAVEEIAQKLDRPISSIKRYLQVPAAERNRQKHAEA